MSNSPPDCCIYIFEPVTANKKEADALHLLLFYGAGDEARTRYLHLGKVALYRMSYTRIGNMAYYTLFREKVKSQFSLFSIIPDLRFLWELASPPA